MRRSTLDDPFSFDTLNARTRVVIPRTQACKSHHPDGRYCSYSDGITSFLRLCLHILFCGKNFQLALLGQNGPIISRTHNFEMHLEFFIRITRRLSCEMTAYNLGLRYHSSYPGLLGLWLSTSLLGRGTLGFNAWEHGEPNGPLRVLKIRGTRIGG